MNETAALTSNGLDIAAMWSQGDRVIQTIAFLLLAMSVVSWAIILGKAWLMLRLRRKTQRSLEAFWNSVTVNDGLSKLRLLPAYHHLVERGQDAIAHIAAHRSEQRHLDTHLSVSEMVTRALRNSIARNVARMESGLTFLASVGSTAPFIGLFGTVWGIYHALATISLTGQSSLDKVAGPVGEALVMTAAGLFVAIPAVLAYNAFTRSLRLITADLEAFAHDLHAYFTTGHPLPMGHGNTSRMAAADMPANVVAEAA